MALDALLLITDGDTGGCTLEGAAAVGAAVGVEGVVVGAETAEEGVEAAATTVAGGVLTVTAVVAGGLRFSGPMLPSNVN